MLTGGFGTAQVIPQRTRLSLVIGLGTLAPKTNLRQMGVGNTYTRRVGTKQTCARLGRQNKLAPDGDKKLTAALNLVTVLNGQEHEDSVKAKDYPLNTLLLEILEEARLWTLSANF